MAQSAPKIRSALHFSIRPLPLVVVQILAVLITLLTLVGLVLLLNTFVFNA